MEKLYDAVEASKKAALEAIYNSAEKTIDNIYSGPKLVTVLPSSSSSATSNAPQPEVANFKPFAIMFQFPSGEWSVERFATEEGARAAAAEAAHEAPGRVVHVVERKAAVMLPENALVWNG
jgi:hypothetical protein